MCAGARRESEDRGTLKRNGRLGGGETIARVSHLSFIEC